DLVMFGRINLSPEFRGHEEHEMVGITPVLLAERPDPVQLPFNFVRLPLLELEPSDPLNRGSMNVEADISPLIWCSICLQRNRWPSVFRYILGGLLLSDFNGFDNPRVFQLRGWLSCCTLTSRIPVQCSLRDRKVS